MNILISACLLGVNCRFDGGNTYLEEFEQLKEKYNLIPICPEILGGLSTPRESSEIIGNRVLSKSGKDVTKNFEKGANEALKLAKFYNVRYAILKERSPSCGFKEIYDGSFTGKTHKGDGVTASLFKENGIKILGESEIQKLF